MRPELEDNAESVLQERYYLKDENGRATEDASGLFYRVELQARRDSGVGFTTRIREWYLGTQVG